MIVISMRATSIKYDSGDEELRDSLDTRWWNLLQTALHGRVFLPIPNIGLEIDRFLRELPVTGVILSGGEDWGAYPKRDDTEIALFNFARKKSLPLLGVCRGCQVINLLSGGACGEGNIQTHVCKYHDVNLLKNPFMEKRSISVNSYHKRIITKLAPDLLPFAFAQDNTVEGFTNKDKQLAGIMWHPEREDRIKEHDAQLLRNLFKEE